MGARAVQEHSNQKCRHSSAATSASTAVAGVASLAAVNSDVTGKKAEEGRKESMGAQWNQRLDGRDRQLNIGKHGNIVTGGEFADCLSDSDIDSVLHPILGANYLPARLLYDFQRGVVAAEEVRKQLNDAMIMGSNTR